MERAIVRGKIDFEADPRTVTLMVFAAPSTGGRGRATEAGTWELDELAPGDFDEYFDTVLPDNTPA